MEKNMENEIETGVTIHCLCNCIMPFTFSSFWGQAGHARLHLPHPPLPRLATMTRYKRLYLSMLAAKKKGGMIIGHPSIHPS